VILGLVGCGHIGGSLALALRQAGAAGRVFGADRDGAAAARALSLGIIDQAASVAEVAAAADVLVLAVPVLSIPACARAIAGALRPGAVVTDVGSTKASVVRACAQILPRFVGGHPMAGSERAGPDSADARLFAGKRVILTPTAGTDRDALGAVARMWRDVGATVVEMDPTRHDAVVAAVSHLPHAAAYALCAALTGEAPELAGLSGGGFIDSTRIAATPGAMWVDVFLDNRGPLLSLLDAYRDELARLRAAIAAGDGAAIAGLIDVARAARARIVS
jgi:prephenate dehydrogenase